MQILCPRWLVFVDREHVIIESDAVIAEIWAMGTGQVVQMLAGHADLLPRWPSRLKWLNYDAVLRHSLCGTVL